MNNRFTELFGLMHNNRSNRIITEFGLSDKYQVQDGLDQGETSLPIMWKIFYDLLLCEVKQANYHQGYQLTAKWKKWDNQPDTQSLIASVNHFAFVDDTVWIANSKQEMQSILDTASSFFRMVDIEINLDKTETMVVRPSKRKSLLMWIRADKKNETVLKIIGSDIETVYGIIRKKHITEKQMIYIFNSVLTTVKKKAKLSVDFPASTMHHSSLYNLFKIDNIQAKSKITDLLVRLNSNNITGMVSKIRLANLQAQRYNTHGVPESSRPHAHLIETVIASGATYTKVRDLLRKENILYLYQFKVLESTIIIDEYKNIDVAQCEALEIHKLDTQIPDDLETMQRDSIYIHIPDTLLPQWRREIEISTDGSLVKAGSVEARRAAAFVIHRMEASYSIAVNRTLSSTKTEAKAVLLALEANAIKAVIGEKKIDLTINKVAAHTGVFENEKADKLAKEATAFDTVGWAYNAKNVRDIRTFELKDRLRVHNQAGSLAMHTFIMKSFHNMLPTAEVLYNRRPLVYLNNLLSDNNVNSEVTLVMQRSTSVETIDSEYQVERNIISIAKRKSVNNNPQNSSTVKTARPITPLFRFETTNRPFGSVNTSSRDNTPFRIANTLKRTAPHRRATDFSPITANRLEEKANKKYRHIGRISVKGLTERFNQITEEDLPKNTSVQTNNFVL
ncbi:hypothetical protein G9A89_020389 [Geosiphon pyriformis]|nr:hypothetical protein G9A89_020389 [Geosiphon pyriformis]